MSAPAFWFYADSPADGSGLATWTHTNPSGETVQTEMRFASLRAAQRVDVLICAAFQAGLHEGAAALARELVP